MLRDLLAGSRSVYREREPMSRALEASARVPDFLLVALIGLELAACYLATHLAGGSRTVLPHLFYVPVLVAAARFRWAGATVVALFAGVLAGPLLPSDVSTGAEQPTVAWLGRFAAFLLIGNLVAWLLHRPKAPLRDRVADLRMAGEVRRALRRGEIGVHFQPIVELSTGRMVGVEALCRWDHPARGMIPPAEFVPAAERSGAIRDLGPAVLRLALAHLRGWEGLDPSLTVAVNVSAAELADPALVHTVRLALFDAGIAPERLHLEVTETAVIADVKKAIAQIKALRAVGVQVALDDFGTGQSSLGYLHQFDIDTVKIDRSFTNEIISKPKCARMVRGIVHLAHAIGANTVAEGIETAEQAEQLNRLGCSYGQGYFLGRPASGEAIRHRLTHRSTSDGPR